MICAVLAAAANGEEPGETTAINLQQNTIRIETRIGSETENGFGFIVGEDEEGTLYAVTANHVVSSDEADAEPQAVKVEPVVKVELFRPHGGKLRPAEVLKQDSDRDVAVITFQAPKGFQWNRKCLGSEKDQNRPTKVWFIGRQLEWTIPTSPGTIASPEPDDEEIKIEDLGVMRGSSGGPLIAASGIVGMVVDHSEDAATALSIRFIKRRLEKWRLPFDLEPGAAAPKKTAEESPETEDDTSATPADPILAKGAAIAARDPYFAPLRKMQREGRARDGFDRGMAAAENQTAWGPGKQKMLDELSGDEQEGFRIATYFIVDRNKNSDRAAIGAAIAEADPLVAAARAKSSDPRYWLGFDIATAIFGNPRLGAQGNTATGPGSLGLRDSLMTPEAQRGFNASVAHHLSRKY